RKDNLFVSFVERVEGMKKLFLGTFLAGQDLNIVYQQGIDIADPLAEGRHAVVAHRKDHLVDQVLGGNIADAELRIAAPHLVADRLGQMSLPESHATIEKQRVIRAGRIYSDAASGGVRQL